MTPKLTKSLLLYAALGFFILWVMEILRTDLGHSYWLLMLSLTFLLAYQYFRLRAAPPDSPTKPTPTSSKTYDRPPKRKKKK